jgi:hypothetical protein
MFPGPAYFVMFLFTTVEFQKIQTHDIGLVLRFPAYFFLFYFKVISYTVYEIGWNSRSSPLLYLQLHGTLYIFRIFSNKVCTYEGGGNLNAKVVLLKSQVSESTNLGLALN